MRKRCHIGNAENTKTDCVQCAYSRLSAGTGTSDSYYDTLDTVWPCSLRRLSCRNLCGKRRAFTRAFESCGTGTRPAQGIAFGVGNGNNRIVERRVNVRYRLGYFLLYFLTCSGFSLCFCHRVVLLLHLSSGSFAGTRIGFGALTAYRQPASVSYASITSQVSKSFDIEADVAAQIAFYRVIRNFLTQFIQVAIGQLFDLAAGFDLRIRTNFACAGSADAEYGGQGNLGVLIIGYINSCYTCHTLKIFCFSC